MSSGVTRWLKAGSRTFAGAPELKFAEGLPPIETMGVEGARAFVEASAAASPPGPEVGEVDEEGEPIDDDRGHMMFGATYTDRGAILLADRKFGQFGVATSTGSGLGSPPPEPEAACSGNTSFTTAHSSGVGSTTAIPATLNLRSGNSYQFRDNGDLLQGECARFNFNPFNYYQTPQERWQATTVVSYDFNDHVEFYARGTFSSNESSFQIAPSGTFGTAFFGQLTGFFYARFRT